VSTLVERHQRDGTEVSIATTAGGSPSDEKAVDKLLFVEMFGGYCIALKSH
jgi:hypothetical protein